MMVLLWMYLILNMFLRMKWERWGFSWYVFFFGFYIIYNKDYKNFIYYFKMFIDYMYINLLEKGIKFGICLVVFNYLFCFCIFIL